SARTERRFVGRLRSNKKGFDATTGEDRDDRRNVGWVGVEEVPDRESLELDGRLVTSRKVQLVCPASARDIGQNTGPVPFPVDAARAMRKRRHSVENKPHDPERRPRVLARRRDD